MATPAGYVKVPHPLFVSNWENPRYSQLLTAGQTVTMVDRYAGGGIGRMTDLAVLWVPSTSVGVTGYADLFYYNFYVDGNLVEVIKRLIGISSTNATPPTGVPGPMRYDPPIEFTKRLHIDAVNNDSVSHVAETYCGGFTIYRQKSY